jgi:hypothetical protein
MLARKPGVELILAARSLPALLTLQASLQQTSPSVEVALIDRAKPELMSVRPWLVIDAAGPFQDSGYTLAFAAIGAGAHYVDLADARGFVAGFREALDGAARKAGVLAVTGASSTPALSHAALDLLVAGWRRLDDAAVVISPGARALRGLAVIEAILSYVGHPVRVFRNGGWGVVAGWSHLRRLYMPGVGRRWASICETPDLDLLPERFRILRSALFWAGLELAPMHLGLALLCKLVRWRLVRDLRPLARPLRAGAGLLAPFGTDRGGMVVEACGADAHGHAIRARWALWAEANAGPYTPAAPAAALVAAIIDGRVIQRGAITSAGLLDLDDILAELALFPIRTRIDEGHVDSPILFRRLLGRRFDQLPAGVRSVHGASEPAVFSGSAIARLGASQLARLIRSILGLPKPGRSDVEVQVTPNRFGETWARRFGDASFQSCLVDTGPLGLFEERFGPVRFEFDLQPTATGVLWRMTGWSVTGLPLPRSLGPKIHARADEIGSQYQFRVAVAHPWLGLLFAYRVKLSPLPRGAQQLVTTLAAARAARPSGDASPAARP